jgi:glycosyltransferase involved in cell wall biosynthesis
VTAAADDLAQRLAAVEEQVGALRELSARAYEGTERAAAELMAVRRDHGYSTAFEGEPLVSARIGAYRGGEALFERALASIQAQSYENWEAVVVCDGADQETASRIEELGDSRIRCHQRPRNGPYPEDQIKRWMVAGCHPFNRAVALSRGAWIAPIDQDDQWSSDHIEVLLGAAQRSRAEVVFGVSRVDLGDETETWFGGWPPELGNFGFQAAIYHARLPFLYDANSYLLDEPADWNLARRMLEAGVEFEFIERVVTSYFVDPEGSGWAAWKAREEQTGAFTRGER